MWRRNRVVQTGYPATSIALEMHMFPGVIPGCRIKTPNSVVTGNAMCEVIGHQPVEYPVNRHPVDLQTTPHLCHDLMMRQCARRIE